MSYGQTVKTGRETVTILLLVSRLDTGIMMTYYGFTITDNIKDPYTNKF